MADAHPPELPSRDAAFQDGLPPALPTDDANLLAHPRDDERRRDMPAEDPDAYGPEELPLRPRPPRPGFFGALLWSLFYLLTTKVMAIAIGLCILIILFSGQGESLDKLSDPHLLRTPEFVTAIGPAALVSAGLGVLGAWLAVQIVVGRNWPRLLALRMPGGGQLLLSLMAVPGLVVVAFVIDMLVRHLLVNTAGREGFYWQEAMAALGQWPFYVVLLAVAVGPGLAEELFCRGFLGRGLVARYGPIAGVILTSCFFALIHLEPRRAAVALFMGLVLHTVYLLTRSLLVPMLLHMMSTALGVVMLKYGNPIEQVLSAPWYGMALLGVCGGVSLVCVLWALHQSRGRLVSRSEDYPAWEPTFPGVEYPPRRADTAFVRRWPSFAAWVAALSGLLVFIAGLLLGLVTS